ncbi:MAG TPA: hypothetical protein VGJ06_20800 [Candidatus Acidoferrum sp.]|jgi:hypothetical protein
MQIRHKLKLRLQTFARSHRFLITFLLLASTAIAAEVAWSLSAAECGKLAAQLDIRLGHYTLMLYGLPTSGQPEHLRTLHDRYGVDSKRLAYCTVSRPLINCADSYNAVVFAALRRKFNRDIF